MHGKSAWKDKRRPINWPYQSTFLSNQIRQLSRDIITEEWKNISSQAKRPFMYTLPLEEYVLSKRGQPTRAMVNSLI